MDVVKRMLKNASTWIRELPTPYRFAGVVICAFLVFLFIFGVAGATGDGMVRLVDNVDQDLALQVKTKLDELNYSDYKVRSDGIYVPKEDRDKLILDTSGVLGDEAIYKFLSESNLTISQFQIKQKLHVATERKLAKMISAINSIKRVSVKITPSSKTRRFNFGTPGSHGASAAITIELKPGKMFAMENTVAVANMVSAAVEGMKAEDVKIMDTKGHLYHLPPENSAWRTAVDQMDATRRWIELIEGSVRKLFPDANVSAFVKLAVERKDTEKIEYGKEAVATRFEKESSAGKETTTMSQPGFKGHGSIDTPTGTSATTLSDQEEAGLREDRVPDSTVMKIYTPPGGVEDSSVTVMIPVYEAGDDPDAEIEKRRQEEQGRGTYLKAVQTATGIDAGNITVDFILASKPGEIVGPDTWERVNEILGKWGGTAIIGLIAFVGLIVLYLVLKRLMPRDVVEEIDDLRRKMESEMNPVVPEMAVGEQEVNRMKMTIREVVSRNPRGVAAVLRRWIQGK